MSKLNVSEAGQHFIQLCILRDSAKATSDGRCKLPLLCARTERTFYKLKIKFEENIVRFDHTCVNRAR